MNRRRLLASATAAFWPSLAQARTGFTLETVIDLARAAAALPSAAAEPLSPALRAIDYEAYLSVGTRPERMIWAGAGLPFTADLRPRGYLFPQRVAVHLVENGRATPVAFDPGVLRADPDVLAALDGWSGLRLQHPLNRPDHFDEMAVFQGASYFRSLARGQVYGLSARGLALGAGDMGEEHPAFTAFWLERPAAGQAHVVLHALLESPSVTGAYRFRIQPGATTTFDVEAALFPRTRLDRLGLAPMTSMFFFGPQDRNGVDDFRDAVHDSEGLAMLQADGRRVWRPLGNPPSATRISVFENLRGWGLQQRSRALADYDDLEAQYHRRPSLWVEPLSDWGPGAAHLVELPAKHEGEDNIAVFWRPSTPWPAGEPRRLSYRLHWGDADPAAKPPLTVQATRIGRDAEGGVRLMVIDYGGQASAMAGVEPVVVSDAGAVLNASAAPYPEANLVRVTVRYRPPASGEANINLHLGRREDVVSESWVYRWTA
jgi:glucans biosynthesis protein